MTCPKETAQWHGAGRKLRVLFQYKKNIFHFSGSGNPHCKDKTVMRPFISKMGILVFILKWPPSGVDWLIFGIQVAWRQLSWFDEQTCRSVSTNVSNQRMFSFHSISIWVLSKTPHTTELAPVKSDGLNHTVGQNSMSGNRLSLSASYIVDNRVTAMVCMFWKGGAYEWGYHMFSMSVQFIMMPSHDQIMRIPLTGKTVFLIKRLSQIAS